MINFASVRLARKLPLTLIIGAVLICAGMGTAAYRQMADTLTTRSFEHLETIAAQKAAGLNDILANVSQDLMILAGMATTADAVSAFDGGWAALGADATRALQKRYLEDNPHPADQRQMLATSGENDAYDQTHAAQHPAFLRLARTRAYDDLYLFNPEGQLVYSVYKHADFATNFAESGEPWWDTALGEAYRAARAASAPDTVTLADFAAYEVVLGLSAGFMAAPVFDAGEVIGVLAVRLPIARINSLLADRNGLGETGETLMVGTDFKLRNDSGFTDDNDMLAVTLNNPAVASALAGTSAVGTAADYRGMKSLVAAVPFAFSGQHWAIVTLMDENEALAPLIAMRNNLILTGLGLAVLAALLSLLLTRAITKPLAWLNDAITGLAAGDLDVEVRGARRGDEFGNIARAFESFRETGIRHHSTDAAERDAAARRREEDALMMQALQQAFGEVVDAAVAGDFSRRVDVEFPDPELNSLAGSINNLVATVDRGIGETGHVLAALAETDLTRRVAGDYDGAFAKLKNDTNAVADKLTEIVGQLRDTSGTLKTATTEILTGASDLSERTGKQAATIVQTSGAMAELADTVRHSAGQADIASTKSQAVSQTARQSGEVMERANAAMAEISASSARISNIIGMIDDIAFQTNLLALNASVEAARAGDAGKGFAVVAQEVRRLAQSAATASDEVKVLIEQSVGEVKNGSALVAESAGKLASMLAGIEENTTLMTGMADDAKAQAGAIDDINAVVREMDEMTRHNAALVQQTNAAIEKTEAQAAELDRIIQIFRLHTAEASPAPHADATAFRQERPETASLQTRGNTALKPDWRDF